MMRRGVFNKMRTNVGPNMTPMVDVVMCILIFFMLGTTFAQPELFLKSNTAAIDKAGLGDQGSALKLPSVRMTIKLTRSLTTGPGDPKTVTLVSAFDEAPMPMNAVDDPSQSLNDAIYQRLSARRKIISDDVQVLIVPDKSVPYQDVITIYDYCTKLQFKQVAFFPAK